MTTSDDTRIAGEFTVADWKNAKKLLNEDPTKKSGDEKTKLWDEAFEKFFRTRIETRYFGPIRLLQEMNKNNGEGFSIVTIQCSLIEFFASTIEGKGYKQDPSEK